MTCPEDAPEDEQMEPGTTEGPGEELEPAPKKKRTGKNKEKKNPMVGAHTSEIQS